MAGFDGVTIANKPMFARGLIYFALAALIVIRRVAFVHHWSVLACVIVLFFATKGVFNVCLSLHVEGEDEEEVES